MQGGGSLGSKGMSVVGTLVKGGFGLIPVPVVGAVCKKAWDAGDKLVREKLHKNNLKNAVSIEQKVKFELKAIGGEVAEWDRYRWKIAHAVEQFNKTSSEIQAGISSAPCDAWVRVWAKYEYLLARIAKLRTSVEMMRAVLDETDKWLDEVETACTNKGPQIQALYDKDVSRFKNVDVRIHDACSDYKCVYGTGAWEKKGDVPTSGAAKFFINATSKSLELGFDNDPLGFAVDQVADFGKDSIKEKMEG